MTTKVAELSFHAILDAILKTQKEMRKARRNATPRQRKAIDLHIRFLDKQRASLKKLCMSGRFAVKLDIV